MELDDAIRSRQSIRHFLKKPVDWEIILEAIDAAIQAPLAGNINNFKFVIVQDKETIKKIMKNCDQEWISEAPVLVILCSDNSATHRMYDDRCITYTKQQAGAVIQNFLLTITDFGLGACWVGSFADELIKDCLDVPKNINIEAVIPIGHPRGRTNKVKKARLEKVLFWEKWNTIQKPGLFKEPSQYH